MNRLKYGMAFAIVFMMGLGLSVADNFPHDIVSIIGPSGTTNLQSDNLTADAGGPYEGEVGETIQFYGSVTGGEQPYKYHWTFGGGSSKQQNPTHTYTKAGTYTVRLKVTDSSKPPNKETDTATVTVTGGDNNTLVVDIGGPYNGSVGEEISFNCTAQGGTAPYGYHWTFGGGSSKQQNPTHTYTKAGDYTITLKVTDSNTPPNKVTETTTVTVTGGDNNTLVVDIGGPYNGSVGEEISFNCTAQGGTAPYGYHWTFGGGSSKQQNPTHTYTKAGDYTITLKVTDSNTPPNKVTETTTVTVTGGDNNTLVVDIGGPYNGSVGEEIPFNCTVTGGIGPYEYFWSFGDGTHSNESNPTHLFERQKTYRLWLRVKDSGQKVQTKHNFSWAYITNGTLVVEIGGPYNGSVGEEIHFNCTVQGGIGPYEYFWSFGDGTHSNETNPTHIYEKGKTYLLRLKVQDSAKRVHIRHDFSWVYIT